MVYRHHGERACQVSEDEMKYDKEIDKLVRVLPMEVILVFLEGGTTFNYWTRDEDSFNNLLENWINE